jgi:hypothetical protein
LGRNGASSAQVKRQVIAAADSDAGSRAENPVLEELEDAVPLLDDVGRQEEERDRLASKATSEEAAPVADEKKDPFEEIDFGSFFQDYLDPGYRSSGEMEEIEKPSFENFLSKPGNLSDHLLWQLGAISVRPPVHQAAELIIGNLNEEGYLIASDEELLGIVPVAPPEADVEVTAKIVGEAEALGLVVSEALPASSDADAPELAGSELETSVVAPEDAVTEAVGLAELTAEGTGTEAFLAQDKVETDASMEPSAEVRDSFEQRNQVEAKESEESQVGPEIPPPRHPPGSLI